MTTDFAITCSLVRLGRPRYPVFVHRAAVLLHTSFRPHLAATPLRFANPSPPSGWVKDFHLQAVEHARHTRKRPPTEAASIFMHRFSDGQIDVPGRNPKRRDGPVCYRVLASGAQVHSQTRPGVQRRIHARGMIARERTLKLRLAHRLLTRLRPASRPQQRAIRFSSLSYLLGFPFLGQSQRLGA